MGTPNGTASRLYGRLIAAAAVTAALAGCASWWNLGPEPSSFVGKGDAERLLSDPDLKAVVPHVAGDDPGGGVTFPSVSAPADPTPPASTATAPAAATAPASSATASVTASNAPAPAGSPSLESLSVQDAILDGLQHNVSLRIQRLTVPLARQSEQQALSSFDPTVAGSIQGGQSVTGGNSSDSISANASITEVLPTGTRIVGQATTSSNFYSDSVNSVNASLTVTQSLLRGAGLDVNLASLREAELSTKVTQYQLRDTAETLVASIETAYWDVAFAQRQIAIVQNALDVAQKQLDDTEARVRVQRLAPSELPAAQAQVASSRVNLINAQSALETAQLTFLQLLAPGDRDFWNRTVELTTLPFIPAGAMDPVDVHVDVAMKYRPDLNETLLELQRGDLEIVRTKNGLLPRLDLFLTGGKTGSSYVFGDALARSFDGTDYQAIVGVSGDWEPVNRAAKASYRSAQLSREQQQETLDNQRQLAQLRVRSQYIEVIRTRRQIDATRATREAQQATVDVQKGKLDAGSDTVLNWSIAENQLLADQLAEVQAVTNHLKAVVELYHQEGSLLLRRGLAAPGATPVDYKVK